MSRSFSRGSTALFHPPGRPLLFCPICFLQRFRIIAYRTAPEKNVLTPLIFPTFCAIIIWLRARSSVG